MFSVSGISIDRWAVLALAVSVVLAVWGVLSATGVSDYVRDSFTHRIGEPEVTWAVDELDPDDPPDVRFAVAGDVGTGSDIEYRTAEVVSDRSGFQAFDGLILLGDNVYPSGDPARLRDTVFEPFADVLAAGTSLLPVLGNHDVRDGNREGQVAALDMPGPWYEKRFGDAHFFGLDSTRSTDLQQREWFESAISSSEASWKIVAMHHPPYSSGRRGSDALIRKLYVPLFAAHGIQLVLAGHSHDYQRSQVIDGVTYVVSGAAARKREWERKISQRRRGPRTTS
ncbi:MAG: metallophosphoesterase [Dehalococcoidia bacterium]|jgi:3',5'-cyclic AMP phosphodiesterase CpdA|nr:metallophosphoesterase [Dehalococcoidia bacterium]